MAASFPSGDAQTFSPDFTHHRHIIHGSDADHIRTLAGRDLSPLGQADHIGHICGHHRGGVVQGNSDLGIQMERRLGSRMALAARIMLDGHSVVVATTHLESHAGPEQRAAQMKMLVDALDSYADGQPVLIGGDFNTRTTTKDAMRDTAARRALAREHPDAFIRPHTREPCSRSPRAGYTWPPCNQPLPTERPRTDDPDRPRFRLDWFFARGLICENSRNIPAETPCGTSLSDHDAITTDIRLSEPRQITP